MRIASTVAKTAPPAAPGGGVADIVGQLHQQQMRHRRIERLRTLQFWWYPISLVILGGLVAAVMGQSVLDLPKVTIGILIGLPLLFLTCKRLEFGLLIFAISVSPFIPSALKVSTLYVSPAIPILLLLFFLVLLQTAFHVKKPIVPSLRTIWPLYGLAIMAIISGIQAQATWLYMVPHQILGNPIAFEEGVGIVLYFIPLIVVYTVTASLPHMHHSLPHIHIPYLILALMDSALLIFEFKHISANIYTFRYTSPSIGWIPLEALAQLLVLGCILAYGRFLYATRLQLRIIYGASLLLCLLALYVSLENSWWLEGGIAL